MNGYASRCERVLAERPLAEKCKKYIAAVYTITLKCRMHGRKNLVTLNDFHQLF